MFFQFLGKIQDINSVWSYRLAWSRTQGFHPCNPGSNPGRTARLAIFIMKKDYLEIAKAPDISNLKERKIYRILETIPGAISLGTLLGVLVFSWLKPDWVAIFIILFCLYYLCKIAYLSICQVASYIRMKRNLKINWLEKIKRIERWQEIYHLIILPAFREESGIIKESLNAILNSEYPKENLIVVLSVEERGGEDSLKTAQILEKEYSQKFPHFLATIHPKNIPGELAGKGSNEAWAGKEAKEKIIDKLNIPYKNIIVSSFDIDTRVYPQYFACLTWQYLKSKNPLRESYQPIPVYNNNVWEAPVFTRVVATSNTFWQMMQQERPEKIVTYSSHAMPFKVFSEVGYPKNIVSDDSRIFWKAYLYYDGDYKVQPLYYPVSMDVVLAKNLLRTAVNQYKQQRRWAWGCVEIPYLIHGFFRNKKIPFWNKLMHLTTLIDGFWSWSTSAFLILILGWLPLFLGGEKFSSSTLSYNLPRLTSRIMTFTLLGMLISAILSMFILPPRPAGVSRFKKFSVFFQWLLLPVTLILFGALPALDAQIRLMFGKYMGFWVTEKVRKR